MARYLSVAGPKVKLKEARTPFLTSTAIRGPYRDPVTNGTICSWCGYVGHADDNKDAGGLRLPAENPKNNKETGGLRLPVKDEELPQGRLASVAASVLMKVMYAARMARFDLLRAVQGLAKYLTKWTCAIFTQPKRTK